MIIIFEMGFLLLFDLNHGVHMLFASLYFHKHIALNGVTFQCFSNWRGAPAKPYQTRTLPPTRYDGARVRHGGSSVAPPVFRISRHGAHRQPRLPRQVLSWPVLGIYLFI